jgi:RHH-type proline utilization regulon transcriptional repressor/proline dehydrogenase/delta 1-pyrroline-5-carboxylate dehydrogenase
MAELSVGDPRQLDTDLGPVIDAEARVALEAHVQRMRAAGAAVFQCPLPEACAHGTFFAPTLIEIERMEQLTGEVFGPVLHVLRYREGGLASLIASINATGYGLTHGIQTRIDETIGSICARIRAGNVYVNRNMIGAVVGVQPFGGDGLSGTGPKAGGPNYLRRLVREAPSAPPSIGAELTLPGPTGETNTLLLAPRGRVACLGRSETELRAQVDAALLAGNVAVVARSESSELLRADYGSRCEVVDDPLAALPDAVLVAHDGEAARAIRLRLAEGDGPIVPVIAPDESGRYETARLVRERTLTINTTASGGNASLLSLDEGTG